MTPSKIVLEELLKKLKSDEFKRGDHVTLKKQSVSGDRKWEVIQSNVRDRKNAEMVVRIIFSTDHTGKVLKTILGDLS